LINNLYNIIINNIYNMIYDYVIVGGGPCGMTLAFLLSKYQKDAKILLLEREKHLGGCHRVRRVKTLFTEHGPRIYINNYHTFQQIIKEMGMNYNDYFTNYNFQFLNIFGNIISHLHPLTEFPALAWAYLRFMIYPEWSKHISVGHWMTQHNFSEQSYEYIDRACRLTDGAGADRYTLFEFFHLNNQNFFYQVKQPKKPNDQGFIRDWVQYLKTQCHNLDIQTESDVTQLITNQTHQSKNTPNQKAIHSLVINQHQHVQGRHFLLAIPPKHLLSLLSRSQIYDAFGDWKHLVKWEKDCRYLVYIPIIYHWISQPIVFEKVWGLPDQSEWGLVFIIVSDYMEFDKSQTVMTITITKPDALSHTLGKTPNQCTQEELLAETFRQMTIIFPQLIKHPPEHQILSPGVYKNDNDTWQTKDTAFMLTPNGGYLPAKSDDGYLNLYTVGTHNGTSDYHFTSMESAMENAVTLAQHLIPEIPHTYQKHFRWTIRKVIFGIVLSIILWFSYRRGFFWFSN